MAAKKRAEVEPDNTLGWMITFSDMITLLLTFFVLLLSMCSLEVGKIRDVQRFALDAMGVLLEGERTEIGIATIVSKKGKMKKAIEEWKATSGKYKVLEMKLNREHLLGTVEFEETEKGLNILITDKLLFNSGKEEINPEGIVVLSKIAEVIKEIEVDVVVEGHTDNVPIKTEGFPSNWELSIARAVSVVRYLTEGAGVNPVKFSAVGYGDTKPRVSNDTPENLLKNRRVEIILVPKII